MQMQKRAKQGTMRRKTYVVHNNAMLEKTATYSTNKKVIQHQL
jgi:hypothetical protein